MQSKRETFLPSINHDDVVIFVSSADGSDRAAGSGWTVGI